MATLLAIGKADLHAMHDAIVDRGSPIQANRTLAALRRMCGRAIEHGLIDASPCAGIRAPAALGAPCRAMNFRATVSDIFGKFQNDGVREAIGKSCA